MRRRTRVYIAGPYSADNVITILDNMREGMRLATEVLLCNFAPFCPWIDYQFQLMLRDGEELKVEDYYEYSIAWLDASDCMLLLPNWKKSKGTMKEVEYAQERGIPIFYDIADLIDEMNPYMGGRNGI